MLNIVEIQPIKQTKVTTNLFGGSLRSLFNLLCVRNNHDRIFYLPEQEIRSNGILDMFETHSKRFFQFGRPKNYETATTIIEHYFVQRNTNGSYDDWWQESVLYYNNHDPNGIVCIFC